MNFHPDFHEFAASPERPTYPSMIPPARRGEADAVDALSIAHLSALSMARQELERMRLRTRVGTRVRVIAGGFVGCAAPYATERALVDPVSREPLESAPLPARPPAHAGVVALRWKDALLPAVTLVFDRLAQGGHAAAVALALTDAGFPPPDKAVRWNANSVLRIARNPIYMGEYVYGRTMTHGCAPVAVESADLMDHTPIRVPGFMPRSPISPELFEQVQCVVSRRVRGTRNGDR